MTTSIEGYQLAPQQKRIWLTQKNDIFKSIAAIEIKGHISPTAFQQHIKEIVNDNAILNTTLHKVSGLKIPVQQGNLDNTEVFFEYNDAVHIENINLYVKNIVSERSSVKLNPNKGNSLHISLARCSKEHYIAVISAPSVFADSITLMKFFHQLLLRHSSNKVPEVCVDYFQVSAFFKNILLENEAKEDIDFWKEYTNREPQETLVSTDLFTPETSSSREMFHRYSIDKKNINKPAELSTISKRTVFICAWQILLSKLSNSTNIMLHNVFDGRGDEEFFDAMGPYARVLPIVSEVDGNLPVIDFLTRTENDYHQLEEAQYFNPLTKEYHLDCAYGFEYIEHKLDSVGGLQFEFIYQHSKREHHSLHCTVVENTERIIVILSYDPSRYRSLTVERFTKMYETLLLDILHKPYSKLDEVEILNNHDKNRIIENWTQCTALELPKECFHKLFIEQANLTPDAIALEYQNQKMSYADLNYQSNKIAHELILRGISLGDAVGTCLKRSLVAVVSMLGILKAGAVYVPLDMTYPEKYLTYMAENSGMVLLIVGDSTEDILSDSNVDTLNLDKEHNKVSSHNGLSSPAIEINPNNLAYIIYTSGSTGKPKGVMVTHLSLVNLGNILKKTIHNTVANNGAKYRRASLNAPLSFDASVKQLVLLLQAYTLVLFPDSIRKDGHALSNYLFDNSIEVFDCTPSQLQLLLQAKPGMEGMEYPKKLLIGGEAISSEMWQILSKNHSISAYNLYGPTEATGDALYAEITPSYPVPIIGKPLPNVQVYLLDANKKLVPEGVTGEIYLAGAGLAKGYINDATLTATKFIQNPYSDIAEGRMYQSGDLGRYLANGEIEFMGRADRQVKVRGHRIELPEIERVIANISEVRHATVAIKQTQESVKRIVAYVVPLDLRSLKLMDYPHYALPNGLVVAHQNIHESDYLYQEIFKKRKYLRYGIELYDADCVFDVGGNIGLSTLFFHHECKDLKIFTVEVIPDLADILRKNIELYEVNSTVLSCGLSDIDKQLDISYYPDYSDMSSCYVDADAEEESARTYTPNAMQHSDKNIDGLSKDPLEEQHVSCHLRKLSDIIDEHHVEHIDLLKISVQKDELDILRGISPQHWEKIKQIVMEIHDVQAHIEDTKKLLLNNGYHVDLHQDSVLEGTDCFHLVAIRENEYSKRLELNRKITKSITPSKVAPILSLAKLKDHIKEEIPQHMHPSSFVMLDEIPLNPNGKTDFQKLKEIEEKSLRLLTPYTSPKTPFERILSRFWSEVLEIQDLSIHDNFFELGGDSISQIQVVAKANEAGIMLLPIHIFKYPTLSQLALVAKQLTQE